MDWGADMEREIKDDAWFRRNITWITWDYRRRERIGLYKGKQVTYFHFEVEGSGIHEDAIQACNLGSGWVQFLFSDKDWDGPSAIPYVPLEDGDEVVFDRTPYVWGVKRHVPSFTVKVLTPSGGLIAVLSRGVVPGHCKEKEEVQ